MNSSKKPVAGVLVDAVTRDEARDRIIAAAQDRRAYSVSALAVHGVMTGVDDAEHRYRLNHFDLVTPDGQPVRWALNWLYDSNLRERVYGPDLMLDVCARAARDTLPIFLFGSSGSVVSDLAINLALRFPGLEIVGAQPSQYRTGNDAEVAALARTIKDSGARLCFVGLGCPRQEVFVYEMAQRCSMPMIAVGAAFDYHSGHAPEPPRWMMDRGLQWLYRLAKEPRRLAHRYLVLNPRYVWAVGRQRVSKRERPVPQIAPTETVNYV